MAACTGTNLKGMAGCKKHNLSSFHGIQSCPGQAEGATGGGGSEKNIRGFLPLESPHSPCKSHHGRKQFGLQLFTSLLEKMEKWTLSFHYQVLKTSEMLREINRGNY